MSLFDMPELDLDGLQLRDITDIQIPDIDLDFPEIEMELYALDAEPLDLDFPEIDLDLMNAPETLQMFHECEIELQAFTDDDISDSPAPIVTEVRADRRKAERQCNERKRKKQGSSKAAH